MKSFIEDNLDINEYIKKYPSINFIEIDNEQLDLSDFRVVGTIEEVATDATELNYSFIDFVGEDATDYILRIVLNSFIKSMTDAIKEQLNSQLADNDAINYQLNAINCIAECLYSGESDEAIQLRNLCACSRFGQLTIFNKYSGKVVFLENTDKTEEQFNAAMELAHLLFSTTFNALMNEMAEQYKQNISEFEKKYQQNNLVS